MNSHAAIIISVQFPNFYFLATDIRMTLYCKSNIFVDTEWRFLTIWTICCRKIDNYKHQSCSKHCSLRTVIEGAGLDMLTNLNTGLMWLEDTSYQDHPCSTRTEAPQSLTTSRVNLKV